MGRRLYKCMLICVLLLLSTHSNYAQESRTFPIYFRFDKSEIDTTFRDNRITVLKLIDLIRRPDVMIDSVDIQGYASPDGGHRRNRTLSKERAVSAKNFILQHSPDSLVLNSSRVRIHPMRENWDGLRKAVEEGYHYQNRRELLRIIYKKGLGECTRELMIRDLDNGYTWWLLRKHFMADLRIATLITLYTSSYPDLTKNCKAEILNPVQDLAGIRYPSQFQPRKEEQKVYMAFKTNLLYDLAAIPNIGVEFHLGKGWALGATWGYAWWKYDPKAFYWRTYGGEVDFRKYFGRKSKERPLSGHHLGLYAQGVTYDFCLGSTGILSNLSYGGGLEYGYSVPIGRTLNLDFGIGAGYLGGEYKVYEPIDNHYVWKETRQRHWFGPTKAEISLVWLIGNKAFRKGGAR